MNKAKYLAKNTFIFALGNLGSGLVSFFLLPLYTNVLSTYEYGIVDLVFTVSSFVVPILILNINESIMRFALDEDADKNKIITCGIYIIIFSCVFGFLLSYLLKLYKPVTNYTFYVYLYSVTLGMSKIFLAYLRGQEKLLHFSIGNIIHAALIAILNILFLLKFNMGVNGYFLAYILSNVLTSIYSIIAGGVHKLIGKFVFDKDVFIDMVKYSIVLIPNSFMWWIINSSNRIIITSFLGLSESGIYAVANKIPSFISVISTIFNQAFSYSAIKEEKNSNKKKFINEVFNYLFILSIGCSMFVVLIIKVFMKYYVSADFYIAWKYAIPLVIATCILIFATYLSTSYTVHKDSKGFLRSAILGAIVNLTLNLLLVKRMGIVGSGIATFFTFLSILIYRYFDTSKYVVIDIFNKKYIFSICTLIIEGLCMYFELRFAYIAAIAIILINIVIYRKDIYGLMLIMLGVVKK